MLAWSSRNAVLVMQGSVGVTCGYTEMRRSGGLWVYKAYEALSPYFGADNRISTHINGGSKILGFSQCSSELLFKNFNNKHALWVYRATNIVY